MVSPDTIRTIIGIIGNVISLGLFLSPVPTFYGIWKKGSVEQYSPVPYLATLLNCMMWVVYGLPKVHPHSTLVLTINGSGTVIELTYVFLYLLYCRGGVSGGSGRRRLFVLAALASEVAFVLAVAFVVLSLKYSYRERSMIVGIICVVFCTLMYAAPLSVMKLVIQTKSVEYMPLSISLASFFNGVCWTAYALIHFDLFITIPNGVGLILASTQLILYATYYRSTKRQMEERKMKGGDQVGLSEVVVAAAVDYSAKAAAAAAAAAQHFNGRGREAA